MGRKSAIGPTSLIRMLTGGPSRERYHALKAISQQTARSLEAPLAALLDSSIDETTLVDILHALGKFKIQQANTVDIVVRKVTHKNCRIRCAAASALLQSSPKLRRLLPQIKAVAAREEDNRVKSVLQKLLERYP